jgi:hypothetical protein
MRLADLRALPHEESPAVKERAPAPGVGVGHPHRRKEVHPEQFREFARVDGVSLRARLPDQLDLARVGAADRVPQRLEVLVQPVPVERGFHPDRDRRGKRREDLGDGLERHRQASEHCETSARVIQGAQRDVALVKCESDEGHARLRKWIR